MTLVEGTTFVVTGNRRNVANADYTAVALDELIVYTTLATTSKIVTLPLAAAVPPNWRITIVDQSGSASLALNIQATRAGSDTIPGGFGNAAYLTVPFGVMQLVSDGISKWDLVLAVTPPDATVTLGSSNALVPTQLAVKTYVDTPKVSTIVSNATWTPVGTNDMFTVTAQAAAATTINNPSGTPLNGQRLILRIKSDATPRALTWSGTKWRASSDLALPTTTIASKTLYLEFIYNSTDDKWDLLRLLNNFT